MTWTPPLSLIAERTTGISGSGVWDFTFLLRRDTVLTGQGFDRWAEGYDASVDRSDAEGSYPFAGYQRVQDAIVRRVLAKGQPVVLDIGFGTGVLTERLYQAGCEVYGQDFSSEMIAIARGKMPGAKLCQGDFARGLAAELTERDYDFILATYSLHHLTDPEKVRFLTELRARLRPGGTILIGDVAFKTRTALEACRLAAGEDWDGEEAYFVVEELRKDFPDLCFVPMSPCAGVLSLENE